MSATDLFRRVADAVVAIEVPDGSGAGVLLSLSGLIATSQHLVEGWSTARVAFRDGSRTRGLVVRSWRDPDLAFVQLDPDTARRAVARLPGRLIEEQAPEGRTAVVGETVYALGHPLGLAFTLTRGIVSGVDRRIAGRPYLQVDAAINPGNSGGPLLDARGELLGINACSRVASQGLNFAVPITEVYARFNAYREESRQGPRTYCCVCGTASRDPVYCEHCGALLALADAVAELEAAEAAAPAEAEREVESPDDAPSAGGCPVCGAGNIAGADYCAVCGATL